MIYSKLAKKMRLLLSLLSTKTMDMVNIQLRIFNQ